MAEKEGAEAVSDLLPGGRLVKIEFELRLPAAATKDEIDQWVAFNIGGGSLPLSNPLSGHDLEWWQSPPMLTDTGMIGRTEEYGHQETDSGTAYHCRYIREEQKP